MNDRCWNRWRCCKFCTVWCAEWSMSSQQRTKHAALFWLFRRSRCQRAIPVGNWAVYFEKICKTLVFRWETFWRLNCLQINKRYQKHSNKETRKNKATEKQIQSPIKRGRTDSNKSNKTKGGGTSQTCREKLFLLRKVASQNSEERSVEDQWRFMHFATKCYIPVLYGCVRFLNWNC